jgi:hypothetical protein
MEFYTVGDGSSTVTLCEDCALIATNEVFVGAGMKVAATMAEAAVTAVAMNAAAGVEDHTFSHSSSGSCANCGVAA